MTDYFGWTGRERRELADLLDSLTPQQLTTPSLCGRWTVLDVFGHLVVPLTVGLRGFAAQLLRARGRFDVANDRLARRTAEVGPADLARVLRERADTRFVPPGGTPVFQLTDVLVHGQDIRRPLGVSRIWEPEQVCPVLDFVASPAAARGFVPKGRLAGLYLECPDVGWTGGQIAGQLVRGPAEAVLLAATGRPAGLSDLTGPGVPTLTGRIVR